MDTANRVSRLGAEHTKSAVGIPKTIDNDLDYTDHCPGFGSVARWVATSCAMPA